MAFTDPQNLSVDSIPYVLHRTYSLGSSSVYTDPTEKVKMTVSHARAKRRRSVIRIDFQKTAVDPLVNSQNVVYSTSCALTVDRPLVGFTTNEMQMVVAGLVTYLQSGAWAPTTSFLQGEN